MWTLATPQFGVSMMIPSTRLPSDLATKRTPLRLHQPPADFGSSVKWLINGFPATLLIWTADEWDRLTDRPKDAQECPNGIRCALRME